MTWHTYRQRGWTLKRLITASLADYEFRFGVPAQRMFVPPRQVAAAAEIAPEGVEVKGNGGTLTGEVWLAAKSEPEPEPEPAWTQTSLFLPGTP